MTKTHDERVALAKFQILHDVETGTVPATIAAFADLHDHLDANHYGSLIDDPPRTTDGEIDLTAAAALQAAVDEWIKHGGFNAAVGRIRRLLVVEYDVTGWPQEEIDTLAHEATVQGEANDDKTSASCHRTARVLRAVVQS